MHTIEIILTAEQAKNLNFKGKIAVIIDILRASTTITTLLEREVSGIIPVVTVSEAFSLKKQLGRKGILLIGEREGIKPGGFDYGNSPVEILNLPQQNLKGKQIILTTTNGTKAINNSRNADTILIASMKNLYTVIDFLSRQNKSTVIVCSGTNSQFTIEDFYAGGIIVKELLNSHTPINDITWLSSTIVENPIERVVNSKTCSHLKKLIKINFKEDVEFALQTGNSIVLPTYITEKNLIVNKNNQTQQFVFTPNSL